MTVKLKWWSKDRSATYGTTAVQVCSRRNHGDHRAYRSLYKRHRLCTRIRHPDSLRSWWCSTCHCHGHTWWTSCRCDRRTHQNRRYPSTRTQKWYSCSVQATPRTYCTRRRSTSWDWRVTAGQISACSRGRSVSADWAVRCRASSCRSSR